MTRSLRTRMPGVAFSLEAAETGRPVAIDGLEVVVHEVVALMPTELKPREEPTDASARPRARG
ncbi:MAG: hypothetical protein JNL21_32965 [Myxococcales bacterium]|nr:hypothetical protein [Myxococcales bacterium]